MRLIDADALLEVARNHLALFDSCPGQIGLTGKIRRDEIQNSIADILNAPTVAASPWHRVEEPPKEEGRYWCAVWFDGHWIFDAAWYTHDISTVIDVPCCERVGGFYKGNTEVHPDYWMPIEPPKEDA